MERLLALIARARLIVIREEMRQQILLRKEQERRR